MSSEVGEQRWPGERLGLPAAGPGSVAGWGRRSLALVADWVLSMMAVAAFVGREVWTGEGAALWAPLAVFALQRWVLTATVGASAGQVLTGIRVARLDGRPVGWWNALVRTALLCLVIPPVVYNRDHRGLHDLAVSTVTVVRR
ncbi:MAG: RDD family protein [Actinomycetota bacterium]|nr:RDD family protein [Actinomycetota bacterium]